MTIEQAIKMLEAEYEKAKKQDWIFNPIAYALYQTWKKADTGVRVIRKSNRGDI